MESFAAALDRLTRTFISDVVEAVQASTREQVARSQKSVPVRTTRSAPAPVAPAPVEARPVVVRRFEIPVGRPRRRRTPGTTTRTAAPRNPLVAPVEPVVKFEVVPHPERANRRMVITRLGSNN